VDIVRRALGEQRVGHLGTLDPFAKGLLVLVVGRATRLAPFAAEWPKTYEGVIRLGITTDTDDVTGAVVATAPWTGITPAQLADVIGSFRGAYEQRPPAYSAVKIEGERAYRRARRGEVVTPEPRPVEIRELEIVEAAVPDLGFRATVSAGTYVRSLARDIARSWGAAPSHGAAAHGRRPLLLADAVAPEGVTRSALQDAALLVAHMPRRQVNKKERDAVLHGRAIQRAPVTDSREPIALFEGSQLLAVAEQVGDLLKPAWWWRKADVATGVVTMGTFDGVHRGHHAVLAEVTRRARAGKLASVLVTFDPHPLAVVVRRRRRSF